MEDNKKNMDSTLEENGIDKNTYDYITSMKEKVKNGGEVSREDLERLLLIMGAENKKKHTR